jgi:hypothetical protein
MEKEGDAFDPPAMRSAGKDHSQRRREHCERWNIEIVIAFL